MKTPQYIIDLAEQVVEEIKLTLLKNKKKDTGKLIESINYQINNNNDQYTIEIIALDYLAVIEEGRGKNKKQPPVNSILDWVKRKGINKGLNNKQTKSLAFVIARSIGIKGIKKQPVINISYQKVLNKFIDDIGVYAAAELENNLFLEFNKVFNNQKYQIKL